MSKIIVHEIEQITPGARHVWLNTNIGRIRKPIGAIREANYDFSQLEKNKIVFVESRLLHWGRWVMRVLANGLGYPSQSTTVTALQGSPSTSAPHIPADSEAEEVDRIVQRIEIENKLWATVLKKHYARVDGETLEDVAKAIKVPRSTYCHYLNMARKKVEFYLKST